MGKAVKSEIISEELINIRSFSEDRHGRCDDYPYGGGSGMIMKAEPVLKAVSSVERKGPVLLTSPTGRLLNQALVRDLASYEELSIVCGNYEGIDQRVVDKCIDLEVSVGDYVLSGGEFAALIIIDAVARYVPGFMSNRKSLEDESFEDNLLEYPQYTRPVEINGMSVPRELLSGNHEHIRQWRKNESVKRTKLARPDLYKSFILKKLTGE